ncbi:MAG TPA: RNA-binding S4 domain-containing protein [Candidatus Sulfotelmatobacter sp.]|jgi:ribosome-associated heat shock protein Hsp15|nr:RNA-binding S4 domain-containing protein [Candidatus Sulfotelmatobacter sp.]
MDGLRLDKWLWFARFLKSRSMAQGLIESGEVRLNSQGVSKTSVAVKTGDEVVFYLGRRWRRVKIVGLGTRRGPAPEARTLYEELPPPDLPAPE